MRRLVPTRLERQPWDAATFLIVYAFLLLIIPSRLIFAPLGAAGTPAGVWGMAGLVWWLVFRTGGLLNRDISPVHWAVGIFVLCVLASYASGMATGWHTPADVHQVTDDVYDLIRPTAEGLREKMMLAADRGLMTAASWTGVTLVCVDGLRTWSAVDRVVRWVVRFGAVVGAIGVLQFFTGIHIDEYFRIPGLVANSDFGTILERSVLRRVYATASHPIEFGVIMAAIFPLALHRALTGARGALPWVTAAVLGTAAMLSVSRSAIVTMGVALIIMFAGWTGKWRRMGLVVFPLCVVGLRVLVPGLVGTMTSMWVNLFNDTSTQGRTGDYEIALRILADHVVLGRGLFTFVPRYYRIMDNQMLVALIELGVVGFVSLVGLWAVGYFSARGARRRATLFEHQHLGLALSAAIAGIVLSFFTFDAFAYPMVAGGGCLLIGLAGAAWQNARAAQQAAVAPLGRRREPSAEPPDPKLVRS